MEDFCRTTDAIVLNHEVDLIIQQIDILFDTIPGEVIGDINYGSDFDKFLYELNVGSGVAADYIRQTIIDNVELFGWTIQIEVKFMVGTENDIMLVGIEFSKNSEAYSHVYKIETIEDQNILA